MTEQEGRYSTLTWVTCRTCSATFRVAIPSHYDKMTYVYEESDLEDVEEWQTVNCVNADCSGEFYLELIEEMEE